MKPGIVLFWMILPSAMAFAQLEESSDVFRILKTRDSLLFNVAFNNCNLSQFEKLISEQFEFYHDKAGSIFSKDEFIASIKKGVCAQPYKARRELVEGSVEVYPLAKDGKIYGALQMGRHRFYALEKDKPEYLTSLAKFIHLWLLEKGEWKLSRGISYDHKDRETESKTPDEKLLFKDKRQTEDWLKQQRIPALGVGYIRDGRIEEIQVFGVLEQGKAAPRNTIWNVASLTKPITAMVALLLVNAGEWELDSPLSTYWIDPDIADDPRTATLTTRHILSHQSGFPNWRYAHAQGKLAFEFAPGTRYQYSGEGFEYLRKALERKFHTSINHLADSLIFTPLGMKDTKYYWDSTVDEQRFAKWHDGKGNLYDTYKNTTANGADDLLTTVEDYSKFIAFIINGAGISNELYSQMLSNQVRIKNNKYWGLGWWVDENIQQGENAILNGGDDKGVHTLVFMLPASKQGVVIFTNCDNGTDIYIQTILAYLGAAGQGIIDRETK